MNVLVIGLGSMGKRRIRCLKTLGYNDSQISGFDLRADRRAEVEQQYGIKTFDDVEEAIQGCQPSAFIISVPPDVHHLYMKLALQYNKHFFVEASVLDTDMEMIKNKAQKMDIICAPSATLLFHPAIKKILEIVDSGTLGKISNTIVHVGQWLADWHTYEDVSEFYVSNPATGGAREILPFHLTWLAEVFGFPCKVSGNVRKTVNIVGAERIDDTYNCLLDYKEHLVSVTIDVVSRYATTRILINGDKKQLIWEWDKNCIRIYDGEQAVWESILYEIVSTVAGYNPNIAENMYVEEVKAFLCAIEGKQKFMNNLANDHKILKLLYAIEQSDKEDRHVEFVAL